MEQITLQRPVLRTFSFREWLDGESDFFSMLMEEPVTRMTVLKTHLAIIGMLAASIICGNI